MVVRYCYAFLETKFDSTAFEDLADGARQRRRAVRFLQVVGTRYLGNGVVGVFGKAAGEKNRQSRHMLKKLSGGGGSTHVGHHNVQHREVRPFEFRQP